MTASATVLQEEHLLLGASMEEPEGLGLLVPLSYPDEPKSPDGTETLLCDLTGFPYALVSGSDAQSLIETACAGKRLSVGECAFEAVLFGDGRIVGIPLVLRTGEHEYCLIDPCGTNDACMEWVLALSNLRQGDERVFYDVKVEDATDMLVPLMLMGTESGTVLEDYLAPGMGLPSRNEICSRTLDRIQALLACVPHIDGSYIVLIPPAYARILWRSFLSFPCVDPIGHAAMRRILSARLAWSALLDKDGAAKHADLASHGLIRTDGQFVGLRGLLEG